jgi:hypothetical protein
MLRNVDPFRLWRPSSFSLVSSRILIAVPEGQANRDDESERLEGDVDIGSL